jgi:hypothetical protein
VDGALNGGIESQMEKSEFEMLNLVLPDLGLNLEMKEVEVHMLS